MEPDCNMDIVYTKSVALGILFISIIVLEGEERQINMQSSSAHVAFYELMPLQECFEETTMYAWCVCVCVFLSASSQASSALISCPPPLQSHHVAMG